MGAVLTLTSLCVAIVSLATESMLLGLGAGLLVGAAFGSPTAGWSRSLGIPPFVATLGTLGMAQGLSLIVSDGQSVVGIPHSVRDIYSATLLGVPVPIVMALRDLCGLPRTALPHPLRHLHLRARRQPRGAALCRPLAERLLIAVYAIGGAMAGIAGLLMTARMNSGHPTAGLGLEFDAIAAVAVGGTSFERGNGWLLGTLLGVIAVGVLRNGLNLISHALLGAGRKRRRPRHRRAVPRRPAEPRMTDISKEALVAAPLVPVAGRDPGVLSPARGAADLRGARRAQRLLPEPRQHPQRAATSEPDLLHRLRPDAGGAHRRPRSLRRRQCRAVRLHRRRP